MDKVFILILFIVTLFIGFWVGRIDAVQRWRYSEYCVMINTGDVCNISPGEKPKWPP
jgi:hypothetical protein